MVITATEFKANLGMYLDVSQQKDVFITRNGKMIAKLSNPIVSPTEELVGVLEHVDENIDKHTLRADRLAKHEVSY